MKFVRAVKRRYGMASRPVAVRTHIAWHWRGMFMVLALCLGVGLAWWMYDIGSLYAGFDRGVADRELAQLREKVRSLEEENGRLQSVQVKAERYSQIDGAAQKSQERELKTLRDENAELKEELAFFRGMNSGDNSAGVSIHRFTVERNAAGIYRYQVLLVQSGQREKVFQGRLQLVVMAQDGGRKSSLTIPGNIAENEKFNVSLKSFQRLEGDLPLAAATVVKSVEVRIFANGAAQPKLTKTVNLS